MASCKAGIPSRKLDLASKPKPKNMNARHKENLNENRLRRITRRLKELATRKAAEVILAEKNKREPDLGDILATISRLEERRGELSAAN